MKQQQQHQEGEGAGVSSGDEVGALIAESDEEEEEEECVSSRRASFGSMMGSAPVPRGRIAREQH
jgi:hypothetical protein